MARAPAFMRRPCSVQFGFGGRLLSQRPGEVKLHTSLVTDSALVAASSEFETVREIRSLARSLPPPPGGAGSGPDHRL